jgi:uncharacterized protein (TIGR04255 family)
VNRTQPPLYLSKTPLIFVLAQVRVAPITRIADFLPAIQEDLRHQGFPYLVKREIEFQEVSPQNREARTIRMQWELIDTARTTSVLIDDDGLVLQTTAYVTGEQFLERLDVVLKVYARHARPTTLLRIGLRYIDLITPLEGLPLEKLVSPAIRGAGQALPGDQLTHSWESFRKTGEHTCLRATYWEAHEGPVYPQDLGLFIGLKPSVEPIQKSPFGRLDTDHFDVRPPTEFAVCDINARIGALHDVLIEAFRGLVTQEAILAWK